MEIRRERKCWTILRRDRKIMNRWENGLPGNHNITWRVSSVLFKDKGKISRPIAQAVSRGSDPDKRSGTSRTAQSTVFHPGEDLDP